MSASSDDASISGSDRKRALEIQSHSDGNPVQYGCRACKDINNLRKRLGMAFFVKHLACALQLPHEGFDAPQQHFHGDRGQGQSHQTLQRKHAALADPFADTFGRQQ